MPDADDIATIHRPASPILYKAGAAKVCITPDEPLWLAGYASRTAPGGDKLSELYASALALEDHRGLRLVIVSIDLIAVTPTIAVPIAEAVRQKFGLKREQLLLTATHTHYGPEFRPDKAVFFKIPDEYAAKLPKIAEGLAAAVVQAIGLALERLEPARLFVRKISASFAHNRRRHGVVAGSPSKEDIVDHDVPILDCMSESGNRIAIMFGYACHNTTIPPADRRYCGDWAGFAKEQLERSFPAATSLFMPGAGADQEPEPSGAIELSRQHGEEIAGAVEHALRKPGIEVTGPVQAAWADVPLPLQPVTRESLSAMRVSEDPPQQVKARFLREAINRGDTLISSYSAPLQVVRLGKECLLIALSGEPVVDWSHELKQSAASLQHGPTFSRSDSSLQAPRSPLVWVAGYCNDMFGYLPTRRVQAEGGYEGGRANLWSWIPAPFTDDVEDRIAAAVRKLIDCVSQQSG